MAHFDNEAASDLRLLLSCTSASASPPAAELLSGSSLAPSACLRANSALRQALR